MGKNPAPLRASQVKSRVVRGSPVAVVSSAMPLTWSWTSTPTSTGPTFRRRVAMSSRTRSFATAVARVKIAAAVRVKEVADALVAARGT